MPATITHYGLCAVQVVRKHALTPLKISYTGDRTQILCYCYQKTEEREQGRKKRRGEKLELLRAIFFPQTLPFDRAAG